MSTKTKIQFSQKIEIDQSRKIEETQGDTILAFSDGIRYSIRLRAVDKRILQQIYREIEKPKIFIYQVFSILVFYLVRKHLGNIDKIVIDREYPHHEDYIKRELLEIIKGEAEDFQKENIQFASIGKRSKAHKTAYAVFKKEKTADLTVTLDQIIKIVLKRNLPIKKSGFARVLKRL